MAEPAGFTKADLEVAAGARSYERGLGYLNAVAGLEVTATEITATVYGSSEYRVRLASGGGGISGTCTCPYGQDGFFCDVDKAVAVIDELIKAGKASEAADIAYDAIVWLIDSLEYVDESLGSVDDAVRELFAVHLRACQADRPDPDRLGTDVAQLLLQEEYSWRARQLMESILRDEGDVDGKRNLMKILDQNGL